MVDSSIGKHNVYVEIKLLLVNSLLLCQMYLEPNKKFVYASVIRKINARFYTRIHDSILHLKDDTRADALDLMLHLDVWMTIRDCEYEEQNPKLLDAFTFDNDISFLKPSVGKILLDFFILVQMKYLEHLAKLVNSTKKLNMILGVPIRHQKQQVIISPQLGIILSISQ